MWRPLASSASRIRCLSTIPRHSIASTSLWGPPQAHWMSTTTTTETPPPQLPPPPHLPEDLGHSPSSPLNISSMTNEELADTTTIPGWNLVHSPPVSLPRGALVGIVVSTKMQKTCTVAVTRYRTPNSKMPTKYQRYRKKFLVHDEMEAAQMGDQVLIQPCQRISKRKHFLLREIVQAAGQL